MTNDLIDAGNQLKEAAFKEAMLLIQNMCVRFANFSGPETIVPADEAAYNCAKKAVEDKIRILLGAGVPMGKLRVFADEESESGVAYDIHGTFAQHDELSKFNGALVYLEPKNLEDTERLDFLEAQATPGLNWVCRESETGRGYRLHQGSGNESKTAREAIDRARNK